MEIEGKTGLVHISPGADSFVKDIRQHLNEQDKVKVKVISIDDNGKISLSIKQANVQKKSIKPVEIDWASENKKTSSDAGNFEDIMTRFLKDSEERMQDVKKNQDFKSKSGRKSF
ncbi:S1 RNA-binding domain-containing protein [Clostridium perfringens]|uniref:S1 RNA-binding domain-containing protein n=1 Tax=Clostridium perfringens TaxID=1502 RepID=UPI002ACBFE73|nr:S1 RNA-binding domain-containing protein [Clostridium perfringens]